MPIFLRIEAIEDYCQSLMINDTLGNNQPCQSTIYPNHSILSTSTIYGTCIFGMPLISLHFPSKIKYSEYSKECYLSLKIT